MKKKHYIYILLLSLALSSFSTPFVRAETDELDIFAQAAILIDGDSGQILYEKNAHKELNPASITKLMTALLAIENLNPKDKITFSETAINKIPSNTSRIGIRVDEILTVEQALYGLLLMSSNEVANGIGEKTMGTIEDFVIAMNTRAIELGTQNTHFSNPHGLYAQDHYTSVYDMALITKEIIKSDYFLSIMDESTYQIPQTNKVDEIRYLSQQHKMLNKKNDLTIYREDVIAGKVGYTSESGHTLVTVARQENRTFIAVIMKTDATNLYKDTNKLLDFGFNGFNRIELKASEFQTTLPIYKKEEEIGLATLEIDSSTYLYLNKDLSIDHLTYNETLPESIDKSYKLKDKVGTVSITANNQLLATKDLIITNLEFFKTDSTSKEKNSEDTETKKKPTLLLPILILLSLFTLLEIKIDGSL